MTVNLDDARPGLQYEARDGSIWEYLGKWGGEDAMVFPHRLKCIDTGREDSFTSYGADAVIPEYQRHPLVWQIIARR